MHKLKIHLLPLILLLAILMPSGTAFSQSCEAYYPMDEGVSFEMTSYSAKEKVTGKTKSTIIEKKGSGNEIEAVVKVVHFDKKDKESFSSEYSMFCRDGQFSVDMRNMMGPDNMGSLQGMEIDVDASEMTFPADPQPGTTLDDAHLKVSMRSTGISMGGMQVNVTNRKVVGTETLTTPAGTFECVILTQDVTSKTFGINVRASSKTWYSMGAGTVRSESYNKSGKLMGYEVLTALEK